MFLPCKRSLPAAAASLLAIPMLAIPGSLQAGILYSVQPTEDQRIRFTAATGTTRFEATGDCGRGEFNGREPACAAQAQLLHAACQVAFGS